MPRDPEARAARERRHRRIRRQVAGSAQKPRLCVYRSLNHVYCQLIDDQQGATLAAASSVELEVRKATDGKRKTEVAALVGRLVAQRARAKGIERVVFDRGGYNYHGRVKALAEAAREGGLRF